MKWLTDQQAQSPPMTDLNTPEIADTVRSATNAP